MPTIDYVKYSPKFGTSCLICGAFVELSDLHKVPQICDSCKETIIFIKAHRREIEQIILKEVER